MFALLNSTAHTDSSVPTVDSEALVYSVNLSDLSGYSRDASFNSVPTFQQQTHPFKHDHYDSSLIKGCPNSLMRHVCSSPALRDASVNWKKI